MPAKSAPTSSGTGRLSELARHVVVPSGITTTGWPAVRDKCAELGIEFDLWQDGAGRLILSKREDGQYATSIGGVVMSIPRQVGKTFLLGSIVFALCLLFPNLTVIWTAHRLRTAAETFSAMQGMAGRHRIKPFVKKIVLGSGDEEIQFHNGSRILFGARERGFGRGFAEVDVLVFDEAQILTENAIDDMVPATNQAPNPLILFTGTPPKPSDPGEVFARKRAEALAGESDDTVYIEFSADLGCDPLDREQWRRANPSHPKRTPVAAMLRMRKNLTDDSFVREALGVWDDPNAHSVFPAGAWRALTDRRSHIVGQPIFGIDVSPDRSRVSIGVAGARDDGLAHVEVVDNDPMHAEGGVILRCQQLQATHGGLGFVIDRGSAAGSLIPALEDAGLVVLPMGSRDYAQACGAFYDAVTGSTLRHQGDDQPELAAAVAGARQRPLGDAWAWDRKHVGVDLTPLVAVTLALWGLSAHSSIDMSTQVW